MGRDPKQITSRRDFLREGLRTLLNAGFGGLFSHLEAVAEAEEPKPPALYSGLAWEISNPGESRERWNYEELKKEFEIKGVSLRLEPTYEGSRRDLSHLQAFKAVLQRHGLLITALLLEEELTLSDERTLSRQIEAFTRKVEAVSLLNVPVICFPFETKLLEEGASAVQRLLSSLKALLPILKQHKVRLALKSPAGGIHRVENLLAILKGTDPLWIGVCLLLGNGSGGIGYETCQSLAPHTFHVCLKITSSHERGEEAHLERLLHALKAGGYEGVISLVFEGEGDPIEGAKRGREWIRRYGRGI